MSQGEIETASVETLLETAKDIVQHASERTAIFDPEEEAQLVRFEKDELLLGRVVGRGGFAIVQEITGFHIPEDASIHKNSQSKSSGRSNRSSRRARSLSDGLKRMSSGGSEPGDAISVRSGDSAVAPDLNSRELMSAHCYSAGNKPRFVCKTVNKGLLDENKLTYLKGVVDLALEAKYLTALSHPHILEIRGMSSHGMFDSHGPFLILDRLAETLPKRLKDWMTRDRANKGVTGIFVGGKKKSQSLLVERLRVAFDMASALSYLHGRRVIYRDIKPDNMGFDQRNRVKIFDFGLAKQLHDDERTKDGLYKMTGFTGSIRYMAPEVGRKEPYNELADVYSFSMLLWYIMALEPPYCLYTDNMFMDRVFQRGARPAIFESWPEDISELLKQCWSNDIPDRPSFRKVMTELRDIVAGVDPIAADLMALQDE